jgi:hypothetical protein
MTLTLELSEEVQQALEARASSRGVTLPEYLQDLAAREARRPALLGFFVGNGHEVEDFLRERCEEVERENAQSPAPAMTREQFAAHLDFLREQSQQRTRERRSP